VIWNGLEVLRVGRLENQLVYALVLHINACRGAPSSDVQEEAQGRRNQQTIKPFKNLHICRSLSQVDNEQPPKFVAQLCPIAVKLSPFARYEEEIYVNEQRRN
jgi:hypothetical protein